MKWYEAQSSSQLEPQKVSCPVLHHLACGCRSAVLAGLAAFVAFAVDFVRDHCADDWAVVLVAVLEEDGDPERLFAGLVVVDVASFCCLVPSVDAEEYESWCWNWR